MAFWFFIAAASVAFFGAFFHGVFGRRLYLGEIRKGDLPETIVTLSTVSWDMFTIMLLVSGATLVYAAFTPAAALSVQPVLAMNALGAALFIGLGLSGHKYLIRLPGAYLMGATAVLGFLAL